jgi:hypothetical protein
MSHDSDKTASDKPGAIQIWTSRITFAEGRGRDRDKDDRLQIKTLEAFLAKN